MNRKRVNIQLPSERAPGQLSVAVDSRGHGAAARPGGVKARDTMRRSRACRGSSMLIIEPKYSLNSAGRSIRLMASRAEENFRLGLDSVLPSGALFCGEVLATLFGIEPGRGWAEASPGSDGNSGQGRELVLAGSGRRDLPGPEPAGRRCGHR